MTVPPLDHAAAVALWARYVASGTATAPVGAVPVVDAFGDGPELADELLALVLAGTKRATASLLVEHEIAGEQPPAAGDHWVVCDGSGRPRAILLSHEVRRLRFDEVDESFAYDEGEGDRTLAWWRRAHRRFWERVGARDGFEVTDGSIVVAERFRVVWPPEVADPR